MPGSVDFIELLRKAVANLRLETVDMEPMAAATVMTWVEIIEVIVNGYSPKTTQRLTKGQVSPPADDVATGTGRNGAGA